MALSQLCVEVEKGETLAYAVEASASPAMPTKKRQLRVKHPQQEGTEPTRGLSEIETGESSRLPENDPPTGILERRTSHSTDHLVLSGRNTKGRSDPPTVGHIPVLQPRDENGKRARCWKHLSKVVLVLDVRLYGQPA